MQPPQTDDGRSHTEILKSSAMIGAASGIVILIGIIRTKFMAVILEPAGFGLMGVFNSIVDLGAAIASMGVGGSGVRQIAASAGTGDSQRISTTARVLRHLALVLAAVGGIAMIAFRDLISIATFSTHDYSVAVGILGAAVAFRVISAGQSALVQGTRRIADMAMIGIVGAALGSVVGVALVWRQGEQGVVAAVASMSAATLAASWWYSRRVVVADVKIDAVRAKAEITALLKLGSAFMASGFLTMGAAYAVRAMVLQSDGPDAAGYYQAAWTIGGMYVGIIVQAMGADFYPRLTGAINDHSLMNRLVNEQTQVGLLLAAPGVIATICFAPIGVVLLYSRDFGGAIEALRWICLGMALRVISWPMGFTIIAKGAQGVFLATELAWAIANVGMASLLIPAFGADGAAMAFSGSYVFHLALIYVIARWLTGFRWSTEVWRGVVYFNCLVMLVFLSSKVAPLWLTYAAGVVLLCVVTFVSCKRIATLVDEKQMPASLRAAMRFIRHEQRYDRSQ